MLCKFEDRSSFNILEFTFVIFRLQTKKSTSMTSFFVVVVVVVVVVICDGRSGITAVTANVTLDYESRAYNTITIR